MSTIKEITKLYNSIYENICILEQFRTEILSYDEITERFIALGTAIHDYEGESENLWCIGEYTEASLDDLITGAYWHYTEWHAGQWSDSYRALCSLGTVYTPGYSSLESESESVKYIYNELNKMAETNKGK